MSEQKNIHGDNIAGDKHEHHHYSSEGYQKPIGLDSPKLEVSRLPHTGSKLIGRDKELAILDDAWVNAETNILTLKAMGGTGKTALMKTWLDNLAIDHFQGANAVYTWSFYSQGSAEDKQASADEFFDRALRFFGYEGNAISSAHDKGIKLAELINKQHTLLVLDGLEPLQYPVGTMHGDLKDKGLQALLRQLAAHNQGLCLISSRQYVVELAGKPLVSPYDLGQLEIADGVELLKSFGLTGSELELENAVKEVAGHALALNLLGNYVKTVLQGDIRKRDTITALSAEREEGKHAEKVMAAYETHLKDTTALSILYMMGLFDRPVSTKALQHLRNAKIPQLTDQLGDETDWQYALDDLREQQLLNSTDPNHPDTLDTHPLIREYFGKQLKNNAPKAWQQAHHLLYDYYKDLPEKQQPDTLEEMERLFVAIAHGCAAGMYQQALEDVYWPRIQRKGDNYLCNKLGAFGSDLSALSHFFSQHWHRPATELTDDAKAVVFNWVAFRLRALGRLQEAVQPMQAGLEMRIKQENWKGAASGASSLSELQLTRGAVTDAITSAQQSVELADKIDKQSGGEYQQMAYRTTLADAQHQAGEWTKAQALFETAESLQKESLPESPQLNSVGGFRYCDLLLTAGNWREVQQRAEKTIEIAKRNNWLLDIALDQLSLGRASLEQVIETSSSFPSLQRGNASPDAPASSAETKETVGAEELGGTDHDRAIKMVGSAKLLRSYETQHFQTGILEREKLDETSLDILQTAKNWLDKAVEGLRSSGTEHHLPRGLLARAYYYRFVACVEFAKRGDNGDKTSRVSLALNTGYVSALQDLQEVYEIAQRSGMLLFLTDYHLEAARLCFDMAQESCFKVHELSAEEHIEKAYLLIKKTGYKRRLPELEYLQNFLKVDTQK